jgi:hypothetical protein
MRQAKAKAREPRGIRTTGGLCHHVSFGLVWLLRQPIPQGRPKPTATHLTSQCPSHLSPVNSGRGSGSTSPAHLALEFPVPTPIGRYFFSFSIVNRVADPP